MNRESGVSTLDKDDVMVNARVSAWWKVAPPQAAHRLGLSRFAEWQIARPTGAGYDAAT
jgi:hypothetical protein